MAACSLTAAQLYGCCACRRLHDEVKAAGDSPRLAALTARSVGKALQLMAEKAEYMAATGEGMHALSCLLLKTWNVSR